MPPLARARSPVRRLLRGLLFALAGLLALVAVVAAVGAALPREHTATRTLELSPAPDVVFATLRDVAAAPTWRRDLQRVERLADAGGRPRYREHGEHGAITFEISEEVPARRLVTRIVDDDLPFGGRWTYRLEPEGGGTRLTITEEGEVRSPVFRFVARFVLGHDATLRRVADDLRAHLGGR